MEDAPRPTIKGLFVNSHIRALEHERGPEGLVELLRLSGKPHHYSSTDDVPAVDELKLLECIVELTSPVSLSDEELTYEAGRMHFRNFSTTTMWVLLQQIFGNNLHFVLMQSAWIAGWVFNGISFTSDDLGKHRVRITMFDSVYPIVHFKGFFEQWLHAVHIEGTVEAVALSPNRHEYTISWK